MAPAARLAAVAKASSGAHPRGQGHEHVRRHHRLVGHAAVAGDAADVVERLRAAVVVAGPAQPAHSASPDRLHRHRPAVVGVSRELVADGERVEEPQLQHVQVGAAHAGRGDPDSHPVAGGGGRVHHSRTALNAPDRPHDPIVPACSASQL